MDIQTLLNNLHEEVSCPVCMTTFTEPKQLPCLHSFCLHCLEGIQRTSGRRDIIACPECRREIRLPTSGNLNDLPTNFRINSLLDVLAIRECSTDGVKCGNCDKKSAQSSYCFQCLGFWCSHCITAHNIIRTNREHKLLALKDFQDQDIDEVLKRPAFCPRPGHEKKELEFFCEKCEVPICNACALTSHEGHAKKLLEEAANERKLQINSMIELQKEKVQQKRNRIAKLDENCVQIEAKAAAAKQNVNRFVENLTAVIEAKRREILNKVEIQMKESVERLRTQQCKEDNQVKLIETEIAKTKTLLKRGPSAEIVQLDKLAINTIFQEGVGDEGDEVYCDVEDLCQFIFVQNETLMEKAITEGIGSFKTFLSKTEAQQSSAEGKEISEATVGLEANFVLTTRNAEGEQCYEERDSVTVDIRNHQGHDCATKARVQDNKDGSYNISYFANETGKCDVSVKVNDEHIRGSPYNVQVKPRQYRTVLSFGEYGSSAGMLCYPWELAVNERNEIAVAETSNHRVSVFSSDGTHLRSFGRKGDKQGEFKFPCGVAFDKNSNIIVADRNNHRVQVFSEQGEYLNQFGGQGSLDHQLMYPHGLSVDSDGNVIVADSNNKLIKIFSPSGQFFRKIGGEGSFTYPYHCVEYDKYLIVSDNHEHCIKVFSRDGNFLYKFGKKGEGEGEFNDPGYLSVNKAGHLMVCDSYNHRVQVVELSGKIVTKFGTKGSGIGEFNQPFSTVVLSDGRIVVSDFRNHRIQMFQ
ncbi:E3 ubiquitin-protein ligase TRIM71-like [Oculina patagonica]